jgi:hypothetical protein
VLSRQKDAKSCKKSVKNPSAIRPDGNGARGVKTLTFFRYQEGGCFE